MLLAKHIILYLFMIIHKKMYVYLLLRCYGELTRLYCVSGDYELRGNY